jgi:hypothetical protein
MQSAWGRRVSETILNALIIVVPLLGGIGLLFVCARAIFSNPNVSNSNVAMLGVGALLCVAPTVLNLVIKLPGGGEISLIKKQLQDQNQQIKSDVGEQGAKLNSQIQEIKQQVAAVQKGTNTEPVRQPTPNQGKVVVIYWADARKDLAQKIENYLLQKGYSANTVYTDFTELPESARSPPGTISFVTTEQDESLKNEVAMVLRAKFPEFQRVSDTRASRLVTQGIQIRLF